MMARKPEQCLFAFKPAENQPDGIPILMFLMPEAAWDYMHDGMSHEFDLTRVGIPIKVVIGRTKDQETGMALLQVTNETIDARDADVSFQQDTKKH
jgi:hypothetical protein